MQLSAAVTSTLRAVLPRTARNWLRDPRQTLRWGIDAGRFAVGGAERLDMRSGWVLRAHPVAARYAYQPLRHDPEQRAELDSFIATCTSGMRLLDVGAHFGVFSLAALHYGGRTASAVAVDPSGTAARMLALHARLNGCADRLLVVQACAGEMEGWRGMLDTGVIGAGYFVEADANRRAEDLSTVRAVSIDALCEELAFTPTHLKIDVEGEELAVLRGASGLLTGSPRPTVFLELHNEILADRGRSADDVVSWLTSRGFICQDVLTGGVGPATFARPVSRLVASASVAQPFGAATSTGSF